MRRLPSSPWWIDIPLRGLRTSSTEPSAAVRTIVPLRAWVSRLPGGPGCPTKLRDGTVRAAAMVWAGLVEATRMSLPPRVLVAAAAVRRCAVFGVGCGRDCAAVAAGVRALGVAVAVAGLKGLRVLRLALLAPAAFWFVAVPLTLAAGANGFHGLRPWVAAVPPRLAPLLGSARCAGCGAGTGGRRSG